MKRWLQRAAVGMLFWSQIAIAQSPSADIPSDSDIRNILINRIDQQHQSLGLVVGMIGASGSKVISYGKAAKNDIRPLDGDTVFEIGSVTKVFTALLLTDMVQRNEVALADPVAEYLPANVKVPQRKGKQITLLDLATHTSGLPPVPSNLNKNSANRYANYSTEKLYQFLSTYELPRDIGSQYEYSNLGFGLLGIALARRAQMDYGQLVDSRICGPLGMKSTHIMLSPEMKQRSAIGHNGSLEPVPDWEMPAILGAGALHSTANDLLTFLGDVLGYSKSPLAPAMAAMLDVVRPTDVPGLKIAFGWHILTRDSGEIVWHNGETGGYRAFLGYDPKKRAGVVVLSNTATLIGIDDIGEHLLNKSIPLNTIGQEGQEVKVDPKLFDRYVGRYELRPNFIFTVTREHGKLYIQATHQPKFELSAAGDREFLVKGLAAQITFQADGEAQASSLILHQNGSDLPAKRIK